VVQRASLFAAVRDLTREAGGAWLGDNAPRMGAALAFYTLFSLAPVLIIVVWIAALVFGRTAAQGEVIGQFQSLMGPEASSLVESIIRSSVRNNLDVPNAVVGFFAIVLGASGAFNELQDALNTIWKVESKAKSFWLTSLWQRLFSLSLVAATGFILLTSLLLNTAIAIAQKSLVAFHPIPTIFLQAVNFLLQFGVTLVLFALIFKVVPDVEIPWRDVWMGASISALFLGFGKIAIGLYLGHSSLASAYGAAASLVVLLVWVYYSAQILLFGAELTHAYAMRYGCLASKEQPLGGERKGARGSSESP
jgi:membrane protein